MATKPFFPQVIPAPSVLEERGTVKPPMETDVQIAPSVLDESHLTKPPMTVK